MYYVTGTMSGTQLVLNVIIFIINYWVLQLKLSLYNVKNSLKRIKRILQLKNNEISYYPLGQVQHSKY